MVTVGMNYNVLAGKEEVFERAFAQVIAALKDAPGHTDSHLYKDVAAPTSYLIVSEWNDKAAFDAFIRSESFAKVTNWGKEQILAGRPKHQIYTGSAPLH
ncbi:MAG: antibiotic biosynthesis monooxygenase [Deltaproteobacteria bacterium]|nr:antibiotic biosynthesis monooxygenase [Deltaproteobacteria bacterium]MBI3293309.1 antibiotic biosynthesis monooxygenase [Deltaproteobacteria bacterium]